MFSKLVKYVQSLCANNAFLPGLFEALKGAFDVEFSTDGDVYVYGNTL